MVPGMHSRSRARRQFGWRCWCGVNHLCINSSPETPKGPHYGLVGLDVLLPLVPSQIMTSTAIDTTPDNHDIALDHPYLPVGVQTGSTRTSALSNRIANVLSSSYADADIRHALSILDARGFKNNADTRRKLRLDAQQEVIECNGQIVQDFGKVAEVCVKHTVNRRPIAEPGTLATQAYRRHDRHAQQHLRWDAPAR